MLFWETARSASPQGWTTISASRYGWKNFRQRWKAGDWLKIKPNKEIQIMNWNYPNRLWHRRDLLKAIAATAIAAPAILRGETARTAQRIIKIGYVSPLTGPLAGFGEADRFILGQVRSALAQGLVIGHLTYQVEIINKDSQS